MGTEKRLACSGGQFVDACLRQTHKVALRLWATDRYGFEKRYLTVAWEKRFELMDLRPVIEDL